MTFDEQFLKAMKIRGSALPESADSHDGSVEPFTVDYSVIGGSVVLAKDDFDEMLTANHDLTQGVRTLEEDIRNLRADRPWLVWMGALLGIAIVAILGALRG